MSSDTQPDIDQTNIGDENIQVAGNYNIIQRVTNFFRIDRDQQRAKRNREAMLRLVKNTWVKKALAKSLYAGILIELGIEERLELVERPLDMLLQVPNQTNRLFSSGTPILEIFDEASGALLILGEPGSGKTTKLLELARETIARAEQNVNYPIPVVLNLSTWANLKFPIGDWIVNELNAKYFVAKKDAQPWVENDELLLLLDGLDEVRSDQRVDCIIAINNFRLEHGSTQIVICSRIAEYESLNMRFKLQGAVLLQPLTREKIDKYFEQAGTPLLAVQQALQTDILLQEFVRQPLMLNVISLAYQGTSRLLEREESDTLETWRKRIFDVYIQRMFERMARKKNEQFTSKQTIHYLIYLSKMMLSQGQMMFLLERIQLEWLKNPTQRWFHRIMSALLMGILILLLLSLFAGFSTTNLALSIFVGLYLVMFSGYDRPVELYKWSIKEAIKNIISSFLLAIIVPLIIGSLIVWLLSGWEFVLPFALGGSAGGILVLLIVSGQDNVEVAERLQTNQGIRQSLRNFLVVGGTLFLAILFTEVVGVLLISNSNFGMLANGIVLSPFGMDFYIDLKLLFGIAIMISLFGSMGYGGSSVLHHYLLRFLLYLNGEAPWNYAHFLNYATECIFLQKNGGGYTFVHRLLMDHFATID